MPVVHVIRANGAQETLPAERPIRTHAGAEYVQVKGFARSFTRNADGSVTVDLRVGALAPKSAAAKQAVQARVALAKAPQPTHVAAPAAPKARTAAQLGATVRMCEGNLAAAHASGDADRIAKATKALATARANAGSPAPVAQPAQVDPRTQAQVDAIAAMIAQNPALAAALSKLRR